MSMDKSLPKFFSRIHPKTKTPWVAVIGIMIASMLFTLVGDIVLVANITVFAIVITFAMINLSAIVLRYTHPHIERPFRIPLNVKQFPIPPLFGLGICVYMMLQFELDVVLVGLAILVIGVIFYFFFKRRNPLQNS